MSGVQSFFARLGRIIVALLLVIAGSGPVSSTGQADPSLESPVWPAWVHEHWVWENSGTQESAMQLVQDYLDNDIPVGAVIIDRPWATDSNTFVPDSELYPDLADLVKDFHNMDVRVIMWATSIVNETASNYEEGKEKGYFLSGGRTVKWWGGEGALLDYTNPEAVKWWHKQMDTILDMGIDGWKVDGTDPYVMLLLPAIGYGGKLISWSEYKDACYSDFFEYTRSKLGSDRVISARPVDDQLLNIGLPIVFSNRENNFAGWVGDNDNDWSGLQHALGNMFSSSMFDFVSYGSDIGGFRSDGNQYKDVFIRWTQLGALCPIMENGGNGEHRPWMYDEETTDIYRKFVILHDALIPYIYSEAAYSYELEEPTMRPQQGEYEYLLGDDILVAPMFEEGNDRMIVFPKGDWIYLLDESKTYSEGTETLSFDLDEAPVFIRKGAIIPMDITTDDTGFGSEFSADYTTILMYPDEGEKKFGLYEEDKTGSMISYDKKGDSLEISGTSSERSFLFRVYGEPAPQSVVDDNGKALTEASSMEELVTLNSGYYTDGSGITWIAVKNVTAGINLTVNY